MSLADLPVGLRLKDQAGWNQMPADWQRVVEFEPEGCFLAEMDGAPVGTTVTTCFGETAWIAMVLVEESMRGQGIGTRLMEHALAHLDARGVPGIRLDATPLGRPLYEKLGFRAEYELVRWQGTSPGTGTVHQTVSLDAAGLDRAIQLDRQVTGIDRSRLLRRLHAEQPEQFAGLFRSETLLGYHSLRKGSRATQIGPAIAAEGQWGLTLLEEALARCPAGAVFVDIPVQNEPATRWAESQGFTIQRRLTRMGRGRPVADQPAQIWASFGPEKG
jgi:GNAT superfamily N-acetyltransferase